MPQSRLTRDLLPVVDVLGVPIAGVNQRTFLEATDSWLDERSPTSRGEFICFRDVNGLVQSRRNSLLAVAHAQAFLNCPDGAPVAWLARRRGCVGVERVSGPDMMPAMLAAGLSKRRRHYFLGGTPDTLKALIDRVRHSYPEIQIAGAFAPPFRDQDEFETDELLSQIRVAAPDLLWVGLGCPKQEIWMSQNAKALDGVLSLGVGAAFDILAGRVARAPMAFRRFGLEWLWRILKEPRRLGPRYAIAIPKLIMMAAQDELRRIRIRTPRASGGI